MLLISKPTRQNQSQFWSKTLYTVVQAELTQDIKSEAGTTVTQLCIVCNYIYIESQKLLNHI